MGSTVSPNHRIRNMTFFFQEHSSLKGFSFQFTLFIWYLTILKFSTYKLQTHGFSCFLRVLFCDSDHVSPLRTVDTKTAFTQTRHCFSFMHGKRRKHVCFTETKPGSPKKMCFMESRKHWDSVWTPTWLFSKPRTPTGKTLELSHVLKILCFYYMKLVVGTKNVFLDTFFYETLPKRTVFRES